MELKLNKGVVTFVFLLSFNRTAYGIEIFATCSCN